VVGQATTLFAKQLVEKLIAIIFGDVMLKSFENAALSLADVLAILVEGVMDVLDAPIQVPVLSWPCPARLVYRSAEQLLCRKANVPGYR
jgi:hypothetical protein